MKKIILGLMIFLVTSLFATDVSNFDIKGIKLGMSKDEVLKLMPKGTKLRIFYIADNPNYPYKYEAFYKNNDHMHFLYFEVTLNYKLKVYKIERNIQLSNNANINKVANQVIDHYGKSDYTWKHDNKELELCWGHCLKDKYHFLTQNNDKTFQVTIWKSNEKAGLSLDLLDDKLSNENYEYKKHMLKKAREEIENKASKVDL